jgi:hypothetical protein
METPSRLVEAPSMPSTVYRGLSKDSSRLASRLASRFDEKTFVRPPLSRFARLIEALIEGIEVRKTKVCQAHSPSSNELDNDVVNLAE